MVTIKGAARLAGVKERTIDSWITDGKVDICYTPQHERRVFVDSLWNSFPLALRT